jgi:hypothetical protein
LASSSGDGIEPLFLRLGPDGLHARVQDIRRTAGSTWATLARVPRRRALTLAVAAACGVAGCGGGSDYANTDRPPSPINVTAAISTKKVSISPKTFGAGPIVLIISNQTGAKRKLTLQTAELGGSKPGTKATSNTIDAHDTGTMKVDVREGDYEISVSGGGKAAKLTVGKERASAQDQLLEP